MLERIMSKGIMSRGLCRRDYVGGIMSMGLCPGRIIPEGLCPGDFGGDYLWGDYVCGDIEGSPEKIVTK